jgi:hypothetical protein
VKPSSAPPARQRGLKKYKKMPMEEPPIAEEDMSENQKRKAEAAKLKLENEQREKQAALERKRKEDERLKQEKEQREREEHVKMLENIFKDIAANQPKQEPVK